MKKPPFLLCLCFLAVFGLQLFPGLPSGEARAEQSWADDEPAFGEEANIGTVADPLEPLNRFFFQFNDRLYFWALKPVAQGYSYFIADDVRMCVRDFFRNLMAPVRIVNNLLQGKLQQSGVETARFLINSTVGMVGLADPAKREFGLVSSDEDFGQTLGVYGVGEGIYLCLPFFGPSNLRDAVGLTGDAFLSPTTYVAMSDTGAGIAVESGRKVNATSLTIGDYEDFKESALDPYIAMRDAYRQYRYKKIRDMVVSGDALYSRAPMENSWQAAAVDAVPPGQQDSTPVVATPQEQQASDGVMAGSAFVDHGFFIQVASAANLDQALLAQQKLLQLHRDFQVRVYNWGASRYYGIVVPAGASRAAAKREEKKLCAAGFPGAQMVQ